MWNRIFKLVSSNDKDAQFLAIFHYQTRQKVIRFPGIFSKIQTSTFTGPNKGFMHKIFNWRQMSQYWLLKSVEKSLRPMIISIFQIVYHVAIPN